MDNHLLLEAAELEKNQMWDRAIQNYLKALEFSPDDKEIMLNLGTCLFNNQNYEEALDLYIKCYLHPGQTQAVKTAIVKDILTAYYQPNEEFLRETYNKNRLLFLDYEYSYLKEIPPFESLPYYCIPASDHKYYIINKTNHSFQGMIAIEANIPQTNYAPNDCILSINLYHTAYIEQLLAQTLDSTWMGTMKAPLYFLWNDSLQDIYLQIFIYEPLILTGRAVFLGNETSFFSFFNNLQSIIPNRIIGNLQYCNQVQLWIEQICQSREEVAASGSTEMDCYYRSFNKAYYQNLFQQDYHHLKILFYTSRFSQVVQYSTRDFMKACQNIGINCDLLIEQSDIHRLTYPSMIKKIAEFKPDLVFIINFFRFDWTSLGSVPENLMFVTWVHDPGGQLTSKEHAGNMGKYDFIMAHNKSWLHQMINTGFPERRLLLQTVPIDESLFYPREVTPEERTRFEAEVAFCGNYNLTQETFLEQMINLYTPSYEGEIQAKIIAMLQQCCAMIRNIVYRGELLTITHCINIVDKSCQEFSLEVPTELTHDLALRLDFDLSYILNREYLLHWLIQAGFSLKLWGVKWEINQEFAPYAMGWVQHGAELSKVYSNTKIILGTCALNSGHFRVWESISSGALCMVRNIPPEEDFLDIRDYLSEGEGFVFFNNHQDLIEKIKYYLEHETERKAIVAKGMTQVRRKLTYSSAVRSWMEFMRNGIENLEVD